MRPLAPEIPGLRLRQSRPVEPPPAERVAAPPIRLRFLVLLALAYAVYALVSPRLTAAWKLHGRAAALADYGACMAGPTGPGLLRDHQLAAFEALVRRRLVASPPGEAPFARCAPLARTLTDATEIENAHRAAAASFAEYGARDRPERAIDTLGISSGGLAELAREAWPFVRGYALLVKPSLGAKEAPHPVSAPAPAVGRGLPPGRPLYRAARVEGTEILLAAGTGANSEALHSSDGGATWRSLPASRVQSFAGRCSTGSTGRAFALSTGSDGGTNALSRESGSEPKTTPLGRSNEELVALACDEQTLVAALRVDGKQRTVLRQCVYGGPCAALPSPEFSGSEGAVDFPVDVARVQGTTIVAVTMGKVVRVASSRDGGASWTPFSVAYDGADEPSPRRRPPTELLALGRRVLLYSTPGRTGETYPLVYSDDQGASWHGR